MADLPTITCPCGFSVSGTDEDANVMAADNHTCPNKPGTPWHESVFSFWGLFIVLALAAVVTAIKGQL